MPIDLEHLYAILADVALNHQQVTYGELSRRYYERTQDWYEPHGSWDQVLGELNQILHTIRWPPLSAVVILKDTGEPGGRFWKSSPNVPSRSANDVTRIAAYGRLLGEVHQAHWPATIPLSPRESR